MRTWFNLALIATFLWLSIPAYAKFADNLQGQRLIVHILDVGQGDAIHLRLPDDTDIVVDVGPDERILGALGSVMPMYDKTIELLILTHNHADHIGGLSSLLQEYKVSKIWQSGAKHESATYFNNEKIISTNNVQSTNVSVGAIAKQAGTTINVLYPKEGMIGQNPTDPHDATIVLKIAYGEFCLLLTGDLNTNKTNHEADIISLANTMNLPLNCQALKITHHGSGSGTTEDFLERINPKLAFISVGKRNRYGHPAPSLIKRLQARSITIFRTDEDGTITLTTDGSRFWTKTQK